VAALLTMLWSGAAGAAAARVERPAPPTDSAATVPSGKVAAGVVNLNDASPDELERLPGIGPTRARAIVEHRRAHPFHKVDEITKVKGIGRKTFAKLRPFITVVGPTTLRESPSRN
jgi:competence protein ComEA